jgi:hypothetical protein
VSERRRIAEIASARQAQQQLSRTLAEAIRMYAKAQTNRALHGPPLNSPGMPQPQIWPHPAESEPAMNPYKEDRVELPATRLFENSWSLD